MSKTWADALNAKFPTRPGWGEFQDRNGWVYCCSKAATSVDDWPGHHITVCGEYFYRDDEAIDDAGNPIAPQVEWFWGLPDGGTEIYPTFIEAMQAAEAAHPELFKEA